MSTREDRGPAPIDEPTAWCVVELANGLRMCTNSYDGYRSGARFVAVDGPDGERIGWWLSEQWATPSDAACVLVDLATATRGEAVWDDAYDVELEVAACGAALRICPEGTYVRVIDADGDEVDGGSAYWTCDELAEDPELVMGAVIGALAAQLAN